MKTLLIIDGDNISSNTFSFGWDNLEKDTILEKIVYGDFAKTEMVNWQKYAIENNITPFHCPRTIKKQTTDLHIFIDVMAKLYENDYDKLLLATNDGDFVILANAWIKKNKQVVFLSTTKCSSLISKNFKVITLEDSKKNISKTIKNIITKDEDLLNDIIKKNDDIIKKKKEIIKKNEEGNIKDKLLSFISLHNETTLKSIQLKLEKSHGKIRLKRIKKLLEKFENKHIFIPDNQKNPDNLKVFYYPKLAEIKKQNKKVKTVKTLLKKIHKVYPNFSNHIKLKSVKDI